MPDTSLALFFVADGQRLERQSWPLAVSLFRTHGQDPRVKLIAYTSPDYRAQVAPSTHAIYEACGVQLRDLPPPQNGRRAILTATRSLLPAMIEAPAIRFS